jgi:hypothetical protein
VRRPEAEPGLSHASTARGAHRERDPEVGYERLALRQQDVGGLDVPVDHAPLVRRLQRARHLLRQRDRLVDRQLMLTVEALPERLPFHVRHHVEEEGVRLSRVEEREDMRVLQVGGRLDLGEESLGPHHGGELGLQDLERDLALVLEVVGEVDGRHAALAELALDTVAAFEGRVQAGDRVAHQLGTRRFSSSKKFWTTIALTAGWPPVPTSRTIMNRRSSGAISYERSLNLSTYPSALNSVDTRPRSNESVVASNSATRMSPFALTKNSSRPLCAQTG